MKVLCLLPSRLLSQVLFIAFTLLLTNGAVDAKKHSEKTQKKITILKTKHSSKVKPKLKKNEQITKVSKLRFSRVQTQYSYFGSTEKTYPTLKTSLSNNHYRYKSAAYTVPKATAAFIPASMGALSGLRNTPDPLALKSSVAFVVDANTGEVLLDKNSTTALPIASITKLMTALVVMDSQQDLDEVLMIEEPDLQLEKQVRSRLGLGVQLRRRDALHLALMSSENRAANMLTRYYPGGKAAFVDAMNQKAMQLGMNQSYFVEGTGLASANMASAQDLVKLMKAASHYPLIRELSTQSNLTLTGVTGQSLSFHTTNRLVTHPEWNVLLQKTGFINAAGQCLVMHANIDGRSIMMVLLDSSGKLSRINDATRIRSWLSTQPTDVVSTASPLPYPS
jgi:serine-type D-Ala-D-Ala endopeptidase (penicillin-binding protein 7)